MTFIKWATKLKLLLFHECPQKDKKLFHCPSKPY